MKRVRLLGMFQGIDLGGDELEELSQLELPELFARRELPDPQESTYDPLQDHLDEPFPEELE
jgi:hypothetical protein